MAKVRGTIMATVMARAKTGSETCSGHVVPCILHTLIRLLLEFHSEECIRASEIIVLVYMSYV